MSSCKKNLNNKQRLEILTEILQQEKAGKVNLTEIGRKFNTSRKTVARISEARESLQDITQTGNLVQKRKRPFKEEDVDSALFLWVKAKLQQDARLNLPILKAKATELAKKFDHEFVPSVGWLDRFKERHGLRFKKEHGEKQNSDIEAAELFRSDTLPRLLERFDPNDIFNADETALYFRGLPDKGYAPSGDQLVGGKKAKDRVTILVCANMSGSEKKKLMVIGKSKRPRCFPRDVSKLPVKYTSSSNAWMTGQIFEEHLDTWNRSLRCQAKKILLLLDNCSAHPPTMKFSNIEVFFLPPNTTSSIQPMDMGVIRNLKEHYRKRLNTRIVAELDADETRKAADAIKTITLIDAIHMIHEAWADVKQQTIHNCYKKAGFVVKSTEKTDDIIEEVEPVAPPENMTVEQFESIVTQDEDLDVCGVMTDEEIVQEVKKRKIDPTQDKEEEDDDDEEEEPQTKKELLQTINSMRRFVQTRGKESLMSHFRVLEKEFYLALQESKQQSTIDAMFKK